MCVLQPIHMATKMPRTEDESCTLYIVTVRLVICLPFKGLTLLQSQTNVKASLHVTLICLKPSDPEDQTGLFQGVCGI